MKKNRIPQLYNKLRKQYGHPKGQWGLWCKRPKTVHDREIVIIESILTQNTNWRNVHKAMARLQAARANTLSSIAVVRLRSLARMIAPAGFFNQKSRYLKEVTAFFLRRGGVQKIMKRSLDELRPKILAIHGVGPETADSILLYALDKPTLVIDEYTRRFVKKHKLASQYGYEYLRECFEFCLRRDFRLYQDFHALIVIDGKNNKL